MSLECPGDRGRRVGVDCRVRERAGTPAFLVDHCQRRPAAGVDDHVARSWNGGARATRCSGPRRNAGYIEQADIEVVPFDANHLALALEAFERYGKGISATARLNLGDCCSYAPAKSLGAPLLFKGNDFSQSDIVSAA
jgi:hypothetical protein